MLFFLKWEIDEDVSVVVVCIVFDVKINGDKVVEVYMEKFDCVFRIGLEMEFMGVEFSEVWVVCFNE